MRRGLNQTFERRHGRARGGQHRHGLLHIQIGGQAVGEAVLRDGQGFFLRLDVLIGDGQPCLIAAQVNVIARHFAEQCDQDIALAEFRAGQLRLGRFHGATLAAEHVNFPRCIETGMIEVVLIRRWQVHRQCQAPADSGLAPDARSSRRRRPPWAKDRRRHRRYCARASRTRDWAMRKSRFDCTARAINESNSAS